MRPIKSYQILQLDNPFEETVFRLHIFSSFGRSKDERGFYKKDVLYGKIPIQSNVMTLHTKWYKILNGIKTN